MESHLRHDSAGGSHIAILAVVAWLAAQSAYYRALRSGRVSVVITGMLEGTCAVVFPATADRLR